jgi:O-antigen ligase
VVSLKFLTSRLWFVITLYFIAVRLFQDARNISRFLWLYIIAFGIVITYTLINHSLHGFAQEPAHWVMSPFFKDHTSYGSIIAFYIPVLLGLTINKIGSRTGRGIAVFLLFIYTAGLVFSYTRAAWVGLLAALMVYLAMVFRLKLWVMVLFIVVGVGAYINYADQIEMALEKNREESSDDLAEHVQSISNISSDASNLERINRWNCAIRMWQERPVFGWGPGTYMFEYAPFQHSSDLTIISTNFGTGGNAHSEYLGPLSESGLLGMLSMLFIIAMVIRTALRLFRLARSGWPKVLITTLFLGLITYWTHGILNNYLDTDKASVPFWGFAAILVAIDIYHRKEFLNEEGDEQSSALSEDQTLVS